MDLYKLLTDPHITITLKEAGALMLPVTGTLLGLVYAALIYWLQGGLARLEFTKHLIEDLIILQGKILLDLLVGASAVSLFAIIEATSLIGIAFWIFAVVFSIDLLKATAEQGYVTTLFSKKYIPSHYGPSRQFLRKLTNAGLVGWIRILIPFSIVIGYPIWLGYNQNTPLLISDKAAVIFIFFSSAIALYQISSLLNQAFRAYKIIDRQLLTKNEERAMGADEEVLEWDAKKLSLEKKIISQELRRVGIQPYTTIKELSTKDSWTSRDLRDKPVMTSDEPQVRADGTFGLTLVVPHLDSKEMMGEFIDQWARTILKTLAQSRTEVRHYTITFFRNEGGLIDTHLALVGGSRKDVLEALSKKLEGRAFIKALPQRYFSNAVADY